MNESPASHQDHKPDKRSLGYVPEDIYISSEHVDGFLVTNLTLAFSTLPAALQGRRFLQLSDLHFGPATSKEHLSRACRIASSLSPDAVLLTGDYLQLGTLGLHHLLGRKKRQQHLYIRSKHRAAVRHHVDQLADLLSQIHAPYGTYAVMGNHDYSEGARIIASRLGSEIEWLHNRSTVLRFGQEVVHLAGIDDVRYGAPDIPTAGLYISTAQGIQPGPTLLLCHNPDVTLRPSLSSLSGISAMLCGHTHGGQIRVPKLGPITTQTKQKNHIQGLSYFNTMPVYVSNGVGYGGIRLRVQCPPELVLVEFQRTQRR